MSDSVDLDCKFLKLTFLGDQDAGLAADILDIASSEVKPREQRSSGAWEDWKLLACVLNDGLKSPTLMSLYLYSSHPRSQRNQTCVDT